MVTRRALTALLVCVTFCVTTSTEAGLAVAAEDALLPLQDTGSGAMGASDKSGSPEKPAAALVKKAVTTSDPHDARWHCAHCSKTCTTLKCKSWCEEQWCNKPGSGGSPLFIKTSLNVPPNAGNSWHCSHCNTQCKTSRCTDWCKRMWCAMDADGNPIGWNAKDLHAVYHSPKIHGGKNAMKLLSITKTGSPRLQDMEKNANRIIRLCNKDITGRMIDAAFKAVDSVIDQRNTEQNRFKESETKANEADQKRYKKSKYNKWEAEKDAVDGVAEDVDIEAAKEATQRDQAKEVKFKAEAGDEQQAEKDAEKDIEEENKKFEEKEKAKAAEDQAINDDHDKQVDPEQAIFHMKSPTL